MKPRIQAPIDLRQGLWRVALSQLIPLVLIAAGLVAKAWVQGLPPGDAAGVLLLHPLAVFYGPVWGVQRELNDPAFGHYGLFLLPCAVLMLLGFARVRRVSGQVMAALGLWGWALLGWVGLGAMY